MCILYCHETMVQAIVEERRQALDDQLFLRSFMHERHVRFHAIAMIGGLLIRNGERLDAVEHRERGKSKISEPCLRPGC